MESMIITMIIILIIKWSWHKTDAAARAFQISLITAQSNHLLIKILLISVCMHVHCMTTGTKSTKTGSFFGSLSGAASGDERLEKLISSCLDFCRTMNESSSLWLLLCHPVWGIALSFFFFFFFSGEHAYFEQRSDSLSCADMNLLQAERRQWLSLWDQARQRRYWATADWWDCWENEPRLLRMKYKNKPQQMAKAVSMIRAKDMLVWFRLKTRLVAYFKLLKCGNRTSRPIKITALIILFSDFLQRESHLTRQMELFLKLLDFNQEDDGKETDYD